MEPAGHDLQDEIGGRQDEIRALLARRGPGSTVCPSEVARGHGDDWRELMEPVRRAASELASRGVVVATRRGEVVDPLSEGGPIRLGRGARFEVHGRLGQGRLAQGRVAQDGQEGGGGRHADM